MASTRSLLVQSIGRRRQALFHFSSRIQSPSRFYPSCLKCNLRPAVARAIPVLGDLPGDSSREAQPNPAGGPRSSRHLRFSLSGSFHNCLLGELITSEFACQPPFTQHQYSVTQNQQLG